MDQVASGLVQEEVPAEVWSRETAAATVDLGENALTFVDPEIVRECVTLRALFLDGNALERWPLPVAPGNALPLRQLRLDGNVALRFPTAPGEAFSLCSRLTSLDLSRVAGGDALPAGGALEPATGKKPWRVGGQTRSPRSSDAKIRRRWPKRDRSGAGGLA